jgi:hypothetical protein
MGVPVQPDDLNAFMDKGLLPSSYNKTFHSFHWGSLHLCKSILQSKIIPAVMGVKEEIHHDQQ